MQAGAALGTALTVTAVTLTLYNPLVVQLTLLLFNVRLRLLLYRLLLLWRTMLVAYAATLGMSTGLAPTAVTPAKASNMLLQNGTGGNHQYKGKLVSYILLLRLVQRAPIIARIHSGICRCSNSVHRYWYNCSRLCRRRSFSRPRSCCYTSRYW